VSRLQISPPPPNATLMQVWVLSSPAELRGLRLALQRALADHMSTVSEPLADVPDRMVLGRVS
jgi:serine/threonine-protein kinase RsbW